MEEKIASVVIEGPDNNAPKVFRTTTTCFIHDVPYKIPPLTKEVEFIMRHPPSHIFSIQSQSPRG